MIKKAPLTDDIIISVSKLVDDAKQTTREPSHSAIEYYINRNSLQKGDPKQQQGQSVGKMKRVRAVMNWALENNYDAGERFVVGFLALVRSVGGFRDTSPNYVGNEAILNVQDAFKREGYELTSDGELRSRVLENLSDLEMEDALRSYIRRAKKGSEDAALLAGTGKDLLEAVAAHVHTKKWGSYPQQKNFPTLLGLAFYTLGLAYPEDNIQDQDRTVQQRLEVNLYQLGCTINTLRNKQGTGHGRPFLPDLTDTEAKAAIESMGVISEYLLNKLKEANLTLV